MNVSRKVMSIALTASMLLSMSMPCFAAYIGAGPTQEQETDIHGIGSGIHYPNKDIPLQEFGTMPEFPKDWKDKKAVAKYEKAFDKYMAERDEKREAFVKPYKESLSKVLSPDELKNIGFYEDIHVKVGEKKVVHAWQYGIFDKSYLKPENIHAPYLVYAENGKRNANYTYSTDVNDLYKSKNGQYCLLLTIEGTKEGTDILAVPNYPSDPAYIRIIVDDDKASSTEEKESSDKKISVKKDSESSKKISIKKDEASTNKTTSEDKKVVLTLKNK